MSDERLDSYHSKSKEVWTLGRAKIGINVITRGKTSPEQQFNELWTWPLGKRIMRPRWISCRVNWEAAWGSRGERGSRLPTGTGIGRDALLLADSSSEHCLERLGLPFAKVFSMLITSYRCFEMFQLFWFDSAQRWWCGFRETAAGAAAVNPPGTFLDIQQQKDMEKQIPVFSRKTR